MHKLVFLLLSCLMMNPSTAMIRKYSREDLLAIGKQYNQDLKNKSKKNIKKNEVSEIIKVKDTTGKGGEDSCYAQYVEHTYTVPAGFITNLIFVYIKLSQIKGIPKQSQEPNQFEEEEIQITFKVRTTVKSLRKIINESAKLYPRSEDLLIVPPPSCVQETGQCIIEYPAHLKFFMECVQIIEKSR